MSQTSQSKGRASFCQTAQAPTAQTFLKHSLLKIWLSVSQCALFTNICTQASFAHCPLEKVPRQIRQDEVKLWILYLLFSPPEPAFGSCTAELMLMLMFWGLDLEHCVFISNRVISDGKDSWEWPLLLWFTVNGLCSVVILHSFWNYIIFGTVMLMAWVDQWLKNRILAITQQMEWQLWQTFKQKSNRIYCGKRSFSLWQIYVLQ